MVPDVWEIFAVKILKGLPLGCFGFGFFFFLLGSC